MFQKSLPAVTLQVKLKMFLYLYVHVCVYPAKVLARCYTTLKNKGSCERYGKNCINMLIISE